MAFIVRKKVTIEAQNVTSITAILPDFDENDLLIAHVSHDQNATLTEAGAGSTWEKEIEQVVSSRPTSAVFFLVAGATESNPTFNSTAAARDMIVEIIVVRGAPTTNPIDVSASSGPASAVSQLSQSVTTTVPNTLIMEFITGGDDVNQWVTMPGANEFFLEINGNHLPITGAWYYQNVAGATTQHRFVNARLTDDCVLITIAIKDSGGNVKGCVDPDTLPVEPINPMISVNIATFLTDPVEGISDPTPFLTSVGPKRVITGATQTNPVVITSNNHGLVNTPDGFIEDIVGMTEINDRKFVLANFTTNTFELQGEDGTAHTAYISGGTAAPATTFRVTVGERKVNGLNGGASWGWFTNSSTVQDRPLVSQRRLTSAIDLTSEIIGFSAIGDSIIPLYEVGAKMFGIGSGNNAGQCTGIRFWQYESSDSTVRSNESIVGFVIDTDKAGFEADYGTMDFTDITRIIIGVHTPTTSHEGVGYLYKFKTMNLVSGSANFPASFFDAADHASTGALRTIRNQGGASSGQFFVTQNVQIGNGSTPTFWDSSNESFEFPSAYNEVDRIISINVAQSSFTLSVKASSVDTINLTSTTINCGDLHKFLIDAATSTSATYDFSGFVLTNSIATLNDVGFAIAGATFTKCNEIIKNSCDLSGGGVIIEACVDTRAISISNQADLDDLAAVTFRDNSNIAITITGNQTALTVGANMSFSGNVTDVEYTGATNLTLTVPISSNSLTTTLQSGAGTITLVTPAISYTVTSNVTALIQIFDNLTQTVLDSTTGTSLSHAYLGTPTFSSVVQATGFLPQRRTSILMDGSDFTSSYTLVSDFVYDSGHGLVYLTDLTWSRANNTLAIPTFGPSGRQIHSALIDAFIAQTTLRNTAFNEQMNGPNSMILIEGAEGVADSDIDNMTDTGVQYISVADAVTAEWLGVKSVSTSTPAGTGEFQQVDGSGTTDARAAGDFDQLIKIFGDVTHGNFTLRTHNVLKMQFNTFREVRIDLPTVAEVTTLEPVLYTVGMDPVAITMVAGDPAISITITDHTGAPITKGGKLFDFEIVDNGTNSGELMEREVNFNLSLDGDYKGRNAFNWPPMIGQLGDSFETIQGVVEGISGNHGFYASRGGLDHPDFVRFQSNDGTFFVPEVTSNVTITNMLVAGAEIRLQITNETAKTSPIWTLTTVKSLGDKVLRTTGVGTEFTAGLYYVATTDGTTGGSEPTFPTTIGATVSDGSVVWTTFGILFQDGDPGGTGFSDTYINGEEFITGDTFGIRFAELNGAISFSNFDTFGVVGSTGFAVVVNAVADPVYTINALDGSSTAITDIYTADYVNNEIDLDTNMDFTHPKSFAFISFEQTTSQGMFQIWDSVTAIDAANYRNNSDIISILFDETAGFVKQEDSDTSRWFRTDGARPFKDPTTGGFGISMNWKNPVFTISTGSVLTAPEKAQLTQASEAQAVNTKVGTPVATVSSDIASIDSKVVIIDTNVDTSLVNQTNIEGKIDVLPTDAENADKLLGRSIQGGADGGRTVTQALRASRNRVDMVNGDVYEEDDSTVSHSYSITRSPLDIVSEVDPT